MNGEKLEYFQKVLNELKQAKIVPNNIYIEETEDEDTGTTAYPVIGMILLNFEEMDDKSILKEQLHH